MERTEILKTLAVIKVAYPNSFLKMSSQDFETLANLWEMQFSEYDYKLVITAINTIIANDQNQFMPTIARIKEVCRNLLNPNSISDEQAWLYIKKAISNGIYHAREEFEKLPTECQKLVGNPGRLRDWAMMDSSEIETIVHSNFLKSFKAQQENSKLQNSIPLAYKEKLMIGERNG